MKRLFGLNFHRHHLPLLAIGLILAVTGISISNPVRSWADTLSQNVTCDDGSPTLNIAVNKANHTAAVTCKSGALLYYIASDDPVTTHPYLGVTVTCPGVETVGSLPVKNLNGANSNLVFRCLIIGHGANGDPTGTPTKSNPAAKQVAGIGVTKCADGSQSESGCGGAGSVNLGDVAGKYHCGGNTMGSNGVVENSSIATTINIGCKGKGNAVMDMIFAIIRFLTTGVGLILVASMIFAGIQYTTSRGDPQATASAVNRIRANAWALLLFLFGYALLNYIVPGALLK